MTATRRTQAERTAATRQALLAATVGCLDERGYAGTTTSEVARRAGVSPGALLHHFPTKADLLCAAVSHLFEQRTSEFTKAIADLPVGAEKASAAIDMLWTMFSGPTFVAWLELCVGARTDPDLARAVAGLDQAFMASNESVTREVFAEEAAADPEFPRIAVGMSFSFMTGLALCRLLPGYDPLPAGEFLDLFKSLVRPALPTDRASEDP